MGCPESGQSVYAAVCSNQSEAADVFRGEVWTTTTVIKMKAWGVMVRHTSFDVLCWEGLASVGNRGGMPPKLQLFPGYPKSQGKKYFHTYHRRISSCYKCPERCPALGIFLKVQISL